MRVAQTEAGIKVEMYGHGETSQKTNHKQISHIETKCERKQIQVNGPNKAMNCGDRFHARGTGPRWPGAVGRRCRVWEVTWTAWDESAWSRVLRDVTGAT